jgi:hypothetical protein
MRWVAEIHCCFVQQEIGHVMAESPEGASGLRRNPTSAGVRRGALAYILRRCPLEHRRSVRSVRLHIPHDVLWESEPLPAQRRAFQDAAIHRDG